MMKEIYKPLYPLLKEYWAEPLSEIPPELRQRVEMVFPKWDAILLNPIHTINFAVKVRRDAISYCDNKMNMKKAIRIINSRIVSISKTESFDVIPHKKIKVTYEKKAPAEQNKKRERYDALSAEYDPILEINPTMTAMQLMRVLINNIGKVGTCILNPAADGLVWDPFNSYPKTLTLKQLDSRIHRWRKKNKTHD